MKTATSMSILLSTILAPALAIAAESAKPGDDTAKQIVKTAEMQRGLVVVLQNGDDGLLSRLESIPGTLVQQLEVEDQWAGRLPYVDNLVNLVVVTSDKWQVAREEITRVLAPGGVAFFLNRKSEMGNRKWVKPWPDNIDQWTHFLHGPDNNPVSADTQVGFPATNYWLPAVPIARSTTPPLSPKAARPASFGCCPLRMAKYCTTRRLRPRRFLTGWSWSKAECSSTPPAMKSCAFKARTDETGLNSASAEFRLQACDASIE